MVKIAALMIVWVVEELIMQNKNSRLDKYQVQGQITDGLLDWARDQLKEREIDLLNTLHWEDDGGRLTPVEAKKATPGELKQTTKSTLHGKMNTA